MITKHLIPFTLLFFVAATTTQPADPAAADPIHLTLQKAKDTYNQESDNAKKRLLAFLTVRTDLAQKTGDLNTFKTFDALKTNFESAGTLPENPTDLPVRDNVNNYLFAIRLATKTLSIAYTAAIRDYTKAGQIPQADVLQTEADAFQKSTAYLTPPPPTPPTPTAAVATAQPPAASIENGHPFPFTKSSGLPKIFEPNPNLQLSDNGLLFPSLTYLRTKRTDFINFNFSLDVLVTIKNHEQLKIGIGPAEPGKNSMAGIVLTPNGMALSEAVGQLGKVGPGTHLFHLDKNGPDLTTSIVLNYSGKFTPDYKQVAHLKTMRWLTTENSRLFISATGDGVLIKQILLSQ